MMLPKDAPVPPLDKEWYENDDLWQTWEPVMFTKERLEKIPEEVDRIETLLDLNPSMKILDLCCGIGRHSLEFARRGYHVTGVDRTKCYLDRAKREAQDDGLSIEFILEDMRSFKREEAYDLVICMAGSFGIFVDPSENKQVLNNIYGCLKINGRVLFEGEGKEILARDFKEKEWRSGEYGYALYEDKLVDDWSMLEQTWTHISKDGVMKRWRFRSPIYSATELKTLMKTEGFSRIEIYGNMDGLEYNHLASRLIAVGRKDGI